MVDIGIINRIIDNWYKRSKDDNLDDFDRFISLWISFNAWGCHETGMDADRSMLEKLKKNNKMQDSYVKAKENKGFTEILLQLSNNKIQSKQGEYFLDSEKSLDSLIEMIYQIRCNLFHGRKDPDVDRDKKLVNLARMTLTSIFDNLKIRRDFLLES